MTHEEGIEAAAQEFANCWLASFDSHKIRNNEFAERIIQAYLSASGMVLVPRKPTQEMTEAWDADLDLWFNEKIEPEWHMWNIMLDAAPKPFG